MVIIKEKASPLVIPAMQVENG